MTDQTARTAATTRATSKRAARTARHAGRKSHAAARRAADRAETERARALGRAQARAAGDAAARTNPALLADAAAPAHRATPPCFRSACVRAWRVRCSCHADAQRAAA